MGCTLSSRAGGKNAVSEDAHRDHDEEAYLALKRRYGLPNQHKTDGYEFGLCVRDNVGGVYSTYIGTSKMNNDKVSIKQFNVQHIDPKMIVTEVANLARLSHEAFPRVIELFHTDTAVYMVTSYTDIFRLKNAVDLRNRTSSLSQAEVRKVFKSLVSAVQHCHDHQLLLRCLLPENIMIVRSSPETNATKSSTKGVGADVDVKICDVGMAVQVPRAADSVFNAHPLFDWAYVPYLAPEVAMKQPYTFPCDVWGLGVLLYMMLCARLPFSVEDPMDRALLLQRIKDSEYSFLAEDAVWKSDARIEQAQNLIRGLLAADALNRMSLADIRRSPWLVA